MKFPVFGTTDDAPSNAVANSAIINNVIGNNWMSGESGAQIPLSDDVTITDLTVTLDTAPGAGTSRSFTVRKNGADTGVTVTISDTATTATFSGSVAFSEGDLINLRSVPTATPAAPGNVYWHMFWNTTGANFLIMGRSGGTASASATNYANPCMGDMQATDRNKDIIIPMAGTATKLRVATPAGSPGAGKSYAISGNLNGATDFLTATIADAATSANASGSQAVVAGDTFQMKSVPSGTPTARAPAWCMSITPDVSGESFWGFGVESNASASATNYNAMLGASAWTATENLRYMRLPAVDIKKLHVKIGTAPGALATRTFTLRREVANTALTCAIAGAAATTGSDTTNTVSLTANDRIDLASSVSVPNPAASNVRFGFVIATTQPATGNPAARLPLLGVG